MPDISEMSEWQNKEIHIIIIVAIAIAERPLIMYA
jgi:hypothetical protein